MSEYKIVFSDVDGTLLNSYHRIMPLTQQAIRTLEDKDIPFVIVSARSPSGIYPILRRYDFNCPIISYSGALILDEDRQVLFHKGIKKSRAKEIISYIEEQQFDLSWCLYSLDEWIVKDKNDPRIMREERIVEADAVQGTIDTVTDTQINKILCICNPEKINEIEEKLKSVFPKESIVKSSDILLEIMEDGITKATAIETFCSLKQVDKNQTIAFGDNYNDEEMLNAAGLGFLMDNAPKQLKEKFENITLDHDHEGIYQALKNLGLV